MTTPADSEKFRDVQLEALGSSAQRKQRTLKKALNSNTFSSGSCISTLLKKRQ